MSLYRSSSLHDNPRECYYHAYMHRIAAEQQNGPPPLSDLDHWWFHGPAGSGKSHAAREENPVFYLKRLDKWWDGYENEPCVIIEDYTPEYSKFLTLDLKKWADYYAFPADISGELSFIRPAKIIVTSNYTMDQCFSSPQLECMLRRFKTRDFS